MCGLIDAAPKLADRIRMTTGCDALDTDADAFRVRTDTPCARCRTVTATALLDDSPDPTATPQRLCETCTDWP